MPPAKDWPALCKRLGLTILPNSSHIYGGDCPFCGAHQSFFVWTGDYPVKAKCMECHIKIIVRDDGRPTWPSPFAESGS